MVGLKLASAIHQLSCFDVYLLANNIRILSSISSLLCFCRFGSLLACETFHADVHAGNLWLLHDGRIGFLDFGMHFLFALG